jgi:hypothetical protein
VKRLTGCPAGHLSPDVSLGMGCDGQHPEGSAAVDALSGCRSFEAVKKAVKLVSEDL